MLILASCALTSYPPAKGNYKKMYVSSLGIYQLPQIADIDIKQQRVKETFKYENILIDDAKKMAKADFIKQQKCDLLVEPLLFISTFDRLGITTTTVTISGYPANYKNIRNYEPSDSIYFRNYQQLP